VSATLTVLVATKPGDADPDAPRGDCCRCVVANALHRVTGERWFVTENAARRAVEPREWFPLAEPARAFVRAWDAGESPAAVEFEFAYTVEGRQCESK
jgi:hypothetical protein